MKAKRSKRGLTNPNDPSPGVCYAPVEKGVPNIKKKRHIKVGKDAPQGWIQVPCSKEC